MAMLKQVLFDHMMSREAEEEKEEAEENKQTTGASLSESPEGLSAAREENRASASLQKDDAQLLSGHTGLSETAERNGEGIMQNHFFK